LAARAIEAANADTQAAIEDRRAVMVSMLAEIARTYVELRGEQQEASIARQNLATQQQTLRILQDKNRAGLATQLDISRQAALLASTAAELPAIEGRVRQSIHALGVLVSDSPDALTKELTVAGPLPPTPPEVPVGLPSELLRRRPDIRRAERQFAAATARIGVATADLYPKFSITGQTGFDASAPKNLLRWDSRYLLLSPGIDWPIFDAGRIRSNIAVQREAANVALINYRQSILNALQETDDAISNYRQEQLRRKALVDAVNASQNAVSLAQDQYRQGVSEFLNVLDAQRSLLEAQNALVESDRTIATDLIALYKALGGGWEAEQG
jgi:NodT family efflux transporter outer membrane factor (OMF) lipoprotein